MYILYAGISLSLSLSLANHPTKVVGLVFTAVSFVFSFVCLCLWAVDFVFALFLAAVLVGARRAPVHPLSLSLSLILLSFSGSILARESLCGYVERVNPIERERESAVLIVTVLELF